MCFSLLCTSVWPEIIFQGCSVHQAVRPGRSYIPIFEVRYEINFNVNLTQEGNFIDIFLAGHVSGTYAHHQEH